MVREITAADFDGLMRLYTQLHDNPFPERAGFNRHDKTAFIQWI